MSGRVESVVPTQPAGQVARRLLVRGQVQGVGFRPYVYRLARQMGVAGHVANNAAGALIEVQAAPATLALFQQELIRQLPPLARIDAIECQPIPPGDRREFVIRRSEHAGTAEARVTVDVGICDECLREMLDPADRRYRYPFINCTNCGPRYTIVKRIPYDRPNTAMAAFPMCPDCRTEYENPACRRFHAQPIACPVCGPKVWLTDETGGPIACDDPIRAAADLLRQGRIVAIKGLGGFHLACLAGADAAVARLRQRKGRDHKPFAMMAADLDRIERVAVVSAQSRRLLTSPFKPIVLLARREQNRVSFCVAPGCDTYAVMLPYTPLHHLLFAEDLDLLVMTSGNLADEPIAKDNDEALARLRGIADAFLLHNRDIERRVDDSVIQARGSGMMPIRRARGYVPAPVLLARPVGGQVLAVGAELKNTVCLLRGNQAVLSEHVGDLTNASAYRHFVSAIEHLKGLLEMAPAIVAHDMHPAYLSTQYAKQLRGVRLVPVQHHFAHVVACMAEHDLDEPVIGVACDGTGYGDDGAIWGCEVFRAERTSYTRLGHLRYFPLFGGDAAARQTCRPALGLLYETFGRAAFDLPIAQRVDVAVRNALAEVLIKQVGTVPTSSLGRLFDAAAFLAGVADHNHFEGQAPMALEAAITPDDKYYPHAVVRHGRPFELDYRPLIRAMVADLAAGVARGRMAARFHNAMAEMLTVAAMLVREQTDLGKVVLSGGCFCNRYLTAKLTDKLEGTGFEVFGHRTVPCNDGGVALGQAVFAATVARQAGPQAERGA